MKPFLSLLFALATTQVYAQQQEATITEQPKLQYQQYVAQLQAGNTDIDYYAFRISRLDHKIAKKDAEKLIKLEKKLAKKERPTTIEPWRILHWKCCNSTIHICEYIDTSLTPIKSWAIPLWVINTPG